MNPARRARERKGLLVTFEGIEGSGKTTQIRSLARRLQDEGWSTLEVREPGGTQLGEILREQLLRVGGEPIDARAELFLYLAARAQLVCRRVRPAIAEGRIVLADRFGDASVAYQGGGRSLGAARVRSLVRFATGGLEPTRTYLLDVAPEVSLARVRSRGSLDRFEREDLGFHRRVRAAYRSIARAHPERVRVLRAADPADQLAARVYRDLLPLLPTLPRDHR